MSGEVGDVQSRQRVLGRLGIVVGGAADERKTGQRNQGIDLSEPVLDEEAVDRGPRIETRREGGNHPQAAGLERRDHAVVMGGVAREQIGAQHQHAHRALRPGRERHLLRTLAVAPRHARMVHTDLRIRDRRRHLGGGQEARARTRGVAADQIAHHVRNVLFRSGEPVLQRQEIRPHVLRRARNEAQHLRNTAQHLHLIGARSGGFFLSPAQPLEQRHRPALRTVHAESAHAREPHDLGRRHRANHGVTAVPPRPQRIEQRHEMILEKKHRHEDDVAVLDGVQTFLQRLGF